MSIVLQEEYLLMLIYFYNCFVYISIINHFVTAFYNENAVYIYIYVEELRSNLTSLVGAKKLTYLKK